MLNYLRRWIRVRTGAGRNDAPKWPKYQAKLQLNALEDRLAPAVFNVNSTADILDPAAGVVTLRSAIEAANATPGGNTINLTVAGNYMITLPGTPGEVNNASGEFAISSAGGNLTIQNTSGGDVTVDGNHLARVFDINPIFTVGSATVTDGGSGFTKAPTVTITGGGGTGATATATIANGQVTSVTITNAGTGYTSPPTITFSGGGGKGAAATAIMASPKIAVTMIGFTIENGVAGPGNGTTGEGGGIRDNDNASLILNDMVITDNSASSNGGGVAMANVLSTPWLLSLTNTTISDNHAGDKGGGVDEDGTGKTVISGGLVTGNTSGGEGAGVNLNAISQGGVFGVAITNGGSGFTKAPTVTFTGGGGTGATGTAIISHGKVIGVTITNPGTGFIAAPTISFSGGGKGAAATATLTSESGGLSITGAVIADNKSLDSIGGGVANSGDGAVTIASTTIANNFAGTTGGGFSDENNQGSLVISNSLFMDNVAASDGGGIFVGSPDTTIINSQIEDNISGANGGGIFAGGAKLTVQASTISNNTTSGNGGGIEIETSGGGVANGSSITNSTITGNTALNNNDRASGGGISTAAGFTGSLFLQNDTINGNGAGNGGGVASDGSAGSSIVVQNTIIAGNFGNNGVNGADAVGAFTDDGGNLIGTSGTGSGNTGFTASTTQTGIAADPLDPLLGPLQDNGGPTVGATGDSITLQTEALLPGSKAIAKGIAGGPMVDERGFSVVGEAQGTSPDVGAFQFQNATLSVGLVASSPTTSVGDSETFTITVSNTSANAIPNDNSFVTVTLPSNLMITMVPSGAMVTGNTITISLGALGANSQVQLQVTATAETPGTGLSVAASVVSPDSNPNSVSSSTPITIQ
ncbi:MAG TPA: choice-of-anchor Q domain-containing protein [Gemmata sp.]|nr:choice-of-anchor Q domain-containing protein [Gemmata sp.]